MISIRLLNCRLHLQAVCFSALLFVTNAKGTDSISIEEALDTTNLTWTSTGVVTGQTNVTHDGVDALAMSSYSRVTTTVESLGTLSFWWKATDHESWDFSVGINGEQQLFHLLSADWQKVTLPVDRLEPCTAT